MEAVKQRYGAAAEALEEALCCPVDYDPRYLKVIPEEVLERDYGCGDPSRYVREGETVLDLGAGGGKICFIASQIVGPKGRVIGVDMTDEMLELAKRSQPLVAEKIGYDNVDFRHGYIQDLATDLDALGQWLESHPVKSAADYKKLADKQAELRRTAPLVADNSIDVIVSNCVLNLVPDHEKPQLFREMFRVLKPGGRLLVLEFSKPVLEPLSKVYDAYSFHLLPKMGELIANDADSYRYLAESIRMHPNQETLEGMMQEAGFENTKYFNLTGGIVALHRGYKF